MLQFSCIHPHLLRSIAASTRRFHSFPFVSLQSFLEKPSARLALCNQTQSRCFSTEKPSQSMREKLREVYSKYGKIGIITYFSISTTSFLTMYALLRNGVDLAAIAERFGLDPKRFHSGGALIVALGINKILFPVRIGLTMYVTPKVYRILRKP